MKTITKRDLARFVAESSGNPKSLAARIVDCLFTTMRQQLIAGHRIEIRGFGVLETRDTRPKPAARNPKTGETVYVPARRKTHFKPGKDLKQALHEPLSTDCQPQEGQ